MKKTLVIDNFDSFVFNLVQYVGELGGNPIVFRNNEITFEEAEKLAPTHIIISPGPGNPEDEKYFGVCGNLILKMGSKIPLLGVCLGHQGIAAVFGGRVVKAPEIMHGKASQIFHEGKGILNGLPNPLEGMRYHSLVADEKTFPSCLEVTARTENGLIMGLQHKEFPIYGIQFHPESIGTPEGKRIVKNFLEL
ncbi:aminodeoxychorismate/anthranilate synthase component II [Candidatus Peregrinibacteria bacterium]|nr:aminodeoxychorismate/anthranilate synthase component II [Candidatus Peregrinibacteria bacterium]